MKLIVGNGWLNCSKGGNHRLYSKPWFGWLLILHFFPKEKLSRAGKRIPVGWGWCAILCKRNRIHYGYGFPTVAVARKAMIEEVGFPDDI